MPAFVPVIHNLYFLWQAGNKCRCWQQTLNLFRARETQISKKKTKNKREIETGGKNTLKAAKGPIQHINFRLHSLSVSIVVSASSKYFDFQRDRSEANLPLIKFNGHKTKQKMWTKIHIIYSIFVWFLFTTLANAGYQKWLTRIRRKFEFFFPISKVKGATKFVETTIKTNGSMMIKTEMQ